MASYKKETLCKLTRGKLVVSNVSISRVTIVQKYFLVRALLVLYAMFRMRNIHYIGIPASRVPVFKFNNNNNSLFHSEQSYSLKRVHNTSNVYLL